MDSGKEMQAFYDSAKSRGATDEGIVQLLLGRGWPEEDVYRALADQFEARSGVTVPIYRRSGSAKDAFVYLLSCATLATWAIGPRVRDVHPHQSVDRRSVEPGQRLH